MKTGSRMDVERQRSWKTADHSRSNRREWAGNLRFRSRKCRWRTRDELQERARHRPSENLQEFAVKIPVRIFLTGYVRETIFSRKPQRELDRRQVDV